MKKISLLSTLLNIASIPAAASIQGTFQFNTDHFKSETGLTGEHDQILNKLDWYFEEMRDYNVTSS